MSVSTKNKGDAAHAPGVAVAHRVAIDFCRMQVQEDVGENAESAVARRVVVLVPKDGGVDLSLGRLAEDLHLLFSFGRQIGLQGVKVFLELA